MSKEFEYPKNVYATGSDYLDPLDCGSMVSYKITSHGYFEATVDLTDCGRKISWSFNSGAIEKIDRAITLLCDFRRELVKASKKWDKMEEEAEKFNEANKK